MSALKPTLQMVDTQPLLSLVRQLLLGNVGRCHKQVLTVLSSTSRAGQRDPVARDVMSYSCCWASAATFDSQLVRVHSEEQATA